MQEFVREDVRVRFIGDRYRLEPGLRALMEETEEMTAHCTRLNLTIAINYGGRDEVARAMRRLARDVAEGRLDPDTVDEQTLPRYLDTRVLPDPDLVIRTS
ncbi:MAG TPA: isoprenyl transferase, partial [Roseovarius sp.]|nr:isoprenyl transferase [Roseovarius sp.]